MEEKKDNKKLIMKAGVALIMILIFIFWLWNTKNNFYTQKSETTQNKEDIQSIREDLNDAIDKMNAGLDKIKTTNEELKAASSSLANELIKAADDTASSSTVTPGIIASSSPIIPVIQPDQKKVNSNCPSYINCMPTIGEARDCRIPAGCEGITQIAY